MGKVYVGTSGWSYDHWDPSFYSDVPSAKRLPFYAKFFKTVEINSTFYHLPTRKAVKNWASQVPKNFLFSVKASRLITHFKRLAGCRPSLQQFYRRIRYLQESLGPILFQLPPSFVKNLKRLEGFIHSLHPDYQYVFEFRHPSWFDPEVYALLKKKKIALCISHLAGELSPIEATAPFIYIRLHGPGKGAYEGSYSAQRLGRWAKRIRSWKKNKTIYIYFDNDEKGYAVQDAIKLQNMLS